MCCTTIHKIHLHGHLKQYGETFEFAVINAAEAIKFLAYQLPGFEEVFKIGSYKLVVSNSKQSNDYNDLEQIHFLFGDEPKELHIIPRVQGAKGWGQFFLGVLIMGAAIIAAPFTGGTSITAGITAFTFGTFGATAFSIGAALALGGLASVLQPTPKLVQSNERPEERPSYFLSGPINMVKQGGAMPVLYGRFICGSHIINASLAVVDVDTPRLDSVNAILDVFIKR